MDGEILGSLSLIISQGLLFSFPLFFLSAPFGSSGFGDRCWFGYRWSVVVSIED